MRLERRRPRDRECLPTPPTGGTPEWPPLPRRRDPRRHASARSCPDGERRRRASTGATTRSPMSNDPLPGSPPASTSSVAPRGNRTSAESPCPTSMNVTCKRPSPAARIASRARQRSRALRPPPANDAPRRMHAATSDSALPVSRTRRRQRYQAVSPPT